MKVKAEFVHDVITHNAKITPNYFYWATQIKKASEPQDEVYEVKRCKNEDVYCSRDLMFMIKGKVERVGLFNYHGQRA